MKRKIVLIDGYKFEINEENKLWAINCFKPEFFTVKGKYQGNYFNSSVFRDGNKYNVNINGSSFQVESIAAEAEEINSDQAKILSPMTGIVRDILVKAGEEISTGQLLLRIESMKLVLSVNSSNKGIIKEIRVKTGQKVSAGDFILEIII